MSSGIDFATLTRLMARSDPFDLPDLMLSVATELGTSDVVVYLVDFDQQVLEPLPDRASHDEVPHPEEVETTIAGRAFLQRKAVTAGRPDGTRVWAPIVEGSNPIGVLALTLKAPDEKVLAFCEALGVLAGHVVATQARVTDLYNLYRRRKPMSLAASMQWDLLPPLRMVSRAVTVAGMMEPAYEVGGDFFDYALNGSQLDVAIMDSMGHGVRSAMVVALAAGCYRHNRREGRLLEHVHGGIETVISKECAGAFVTGLVGRLDLASGAFSWINAGHPSPLLLRHGRVIGALEGPRTPPWGVGPSAAEVTTTALEPGDSILLFTDGVTDSRGSPHQDFGLDRLADLASRQASERLPADVVVRRIIRSVLEHHGGNLRDDATVLMLEWTETGGDADY